MQFSSTSTTPDFFATIIAQCKTDSVRHEPRGLVC
jgi:hypothetical protein